MAAGATRCHAASRGMRQSTPITSPPAREKSASSPAVSVPKWITGTPDAAASSSARWLWGNTAHPAVEQLQRPRAGAGLGGQVGAHQLREPLEQLVPRPRLRVHEPLG